MARSRLVVATLLDMAQIPPRRTSSLSHERQQPGRSFPVAGRVVVQQPRQVGAQPVGQRRGTSGEHVADRRGQALDQAAMVRRAIAIGAA
jgi:hypothetical protein